MLERTLKTGVHTTIPLHKFFIFSFFLKEVTKKWVSKQRQSRDSGLAAFSFCDSLQESSQTKIVFMLINSRAFNMPQLAPNSAGRILVFAFWFD